MRGLKSYLGAKCDLIGRMTRKKVGKSTKVIGLISDMRRIMTKNGSYMATFTLEDPTGKIRAVMFPRTYAQYGSQLVEDKVISCKAKLDDKRGECQLICDSAKVLSIDSIIANAKDAGTYNPGDKSDIAIRFLDDILADQEADAEDGDAADGDAAGAESSSKGAASPGAVFKIDIPKSASPEAMQRLKELLMQNKGDTEVELMLQSANKKLKLPFGVEVSDSLKKSITALFNSKS